VLGLTQVIVKIQGARGSREVTLTVDTGSEDTWIERRTLEDIGVEPRFFRTYRTITGTRVQRQVGPVELECLGIKMPCPTVFADEGDANVLGATALEILGLEVDPTTRQLRQVEALAAY